MKCYIIGAGPVDTDRRDIYQYPCLFINSAFLLMPAEQAEKHTWISNSPGCQFWNYYSDVLQSKCKKVVSNRWIKPPKDFLVHKHKASSSLPFAVHYAQSIGYNEIHVLGCQQNHEDGQYFWSGWDNNRPFRLDRPAEWLPDASKQTLVFRANKKTLTTS